MRVDFKDFRLGVSIFAFVCAIEVGAFVSLLLPFVVEEGLGAVFGAWFLAQLVIVPIIVCGAPIFLLCRMMAADIFHRPRATSITCGVIIGTAGSLFLAISNSSPFFWSGMHTLMTGFLAGCAGGWTCWHIESKLRERPR